MVYQQFINYPSLTVYENIASPLRVQGKAKAEIEKRVAEAAKLLKLEPYLDRLTDPGARPPGARTVSYLHLAFPGDLSGTPEPDVQ